MKLKQVEAYQGKPSISADEKSQSVTHNTFMKVTIVQLIVSCMVIVSFFFTTDKLKEGLASKLSDVMKVQEASNAKDSEANVLLKIMVLKPGIDGKLAREIAKSVYLRSHEHNRDPDLVLSIIEVESDFNPNAVSYMGAVGLMQIMPGWVKALAIPRDLRDVDTSINYGLKILGTYEQMYGTLEMSLTAYNRGPSPTTLDLRTGKNPLNGYAESILKTYSRIKSWSRS